MFDRIKIRRIRGQEQQGCARLSDDGFGFRFFVEGRIVHDHEMFFCQARAQHRIKPDVECVRVAGTRTDIYERVTARIIADLEQGVRPWMKPWHVGHTAGRITRPLRHNGTPYRGINVLLLWGEAMEKGYAAPLWMTYKQAQELGAQVRKGEHGALVVYADKITRTETDDAGEASERQIPLATSGSGISDAPQKSLMVMPVKNWLPNWELLFYPRPYKSRRRSGTTMPPIWSTG